MYHFLSGYTAKVAGIEAGVKEPSATSRRASDRHLCGCRRKPMRRCWAAGLREHNAQCWLVNTGWQGGPYGVGNA